MAINTFLEKLQKRKFVRYGAPFLVLVIGGSFGLRQFTNLRYQFRKSKTITEEEAAEYGIGMKAKEERPTLESEYKKVTSDNIDTWENVRGPRPWEDSKTVQDLQRKAQAKLKGS